MVTTGALLMQHVLSDIQQPITWDMECSPGIVNLCYLQNLNLTEDVPTEDLYFPGTNLMMEHGHVPRFDTSVAQMLRPETLFLLVLNCSVQVFVIREMLKVLVLKSNPIEQITLNEGVEQFALEYLQVSRNQLTDLSFVSRLTNLIALEAEHNLLEVLELGVFQNMPNLERILLTGNRIKVIEPSPQWNCKKLSRLTLSQNYLIELNTRLFHTIEHMQLSVDGNNLQTINTVQLATSFPNLATLGYGHNPWNCGRLKALQDQLQLLGLEQDVSATDCSDGEALHTIALNLPDEVDLADAALRDFRVRQRVLMDDLEDNLRLRRVQRRFENVQWMLRKTSEDLPKLRQKYEALRGTVKYMDFYDKVTLIDKLKT